MRRVVLLLVLVALGLGALVFFSLPRAVESPPAAPVSDSEPRRQIVGRSVEGRVIEAYVFGNGSIPLLFVGGIHGGYEWNSVLLAYRLIDYLEANPDTVPRNLQVTVIPSANPDGVYKVIGKAGRFALADVAVSKEASAPGRFNANEVDLNRNFDCKWQPTSTWQTKTVSAGARPFSEPEARAIQNFVLTNKPAAAIFWHSQANAVYASECEQGILPETLKIMNAYALAAGYPAVKSFDSYEITGDVEGWLASLKIPAITVELQTHETIEWERNLAGVKALFAYYGQ